MDNKKKEMRPVSVFQKILEDKRIIRECIQKGGDIKEIKFYLCYLAIAVEKNNMISTKKNNKN